MSIDWITVAAQLANFLLLVWLLKRFLYRPILDGIDAREAEITDRMQVAVRAREDAKTAEANYHDRLAKLQSEQATVSEAARRDGEAARDTLLAEAHDRIERERAAWAAHLDAEARDFTTRLHRAGGHALLELTRKALTDLADDTLEARIAAHLARKISGMAEDLQHAAGEAAAGVVTTHAALPGDVKDQITTELSHRFPGIVLRFDVDASHSPGLSLRLGGAHLAWTVESYIDDLGALMAEDLAAAADMRASSG
jgi:F-type H+-transporting ATPase subunit b